MDWGIPNCIGDVHDIIYLKWQNLGGSVIIVGLSKAQAAHLWMINFCKVYMAKKTSKKTTKKKTTKKKPKVIKSKKVCEFC